MRARIMRLCFSLSTLATLAYTTGAPRKWLF